MEANNITVSVPTGKCPINCPYCVSKMTYNVESDDYRFQKNLLKAAWYAERCKVTHCLITAKGDPLEYIKIQEIIEAFYKFPIELQIHYKSINKLFQIFPDNYDGWIKDIDILAISIDTPQQLNNFLEFTKLIVNKTIFSGFVRATICLNKSFKGYTIEELIDIIINNPVIKQLTIRNITVPEKRNPSALSLKTQNWIRENVDDNDYITMQREINILKNHHIADHVRNLYFDSSVYDISDIGVVTMDYCTESENRDIIRSLIYQSDGHLYTTWDHPGSILF